jgi:hypothetical protein
MKMLQDMTRSRWFDTAEAARSSRRGGVLLERDWLPLVGLSIIETKAMLKDAFGISYFADAFVNGSQVPVAHLLRPGDRLEFVQRFGFKAGDDHAAEKVLAEALLRAEPELARMVDEVYELRMPVDKRLAVMALRIFQWSEKRFGPVTADAAAMLNKLVSEFTRLAGGGQSQTSSRQPRIPISERVRVDIAGGKVVIDGVHHALDPISLAIIDCLVAADGIVVSRAEMKERSDTLKNVSHIERCITQLQETNKPVGRILEKDDRNRGFRIRRDF